MNILLTGANQRIGLYLATRLLSQGHHVIALVRSPSDALRVLMRGYEDMLTVHHADLLTMKWNTPFWQQYPHIDHIIHCASIFPHDDAHSSTQEYRDECRMLHYDTLVNSSVNWFQHGGSGSVVHFLDQKVQRLNPDHLSYTLSKMAAASAIPVLAQTLAPSIRVNAIAPGITLPSGDQTQHDFEHAVMALPLGMGSTLASLGDTVEFFLSHPNITGQIMTVDGGQHLMSDRDILFSSNTMLS